MRSRLLLFVLILLFASTLTGTMLDNLLVNWDRQGFIDKELSESARLLIEARFPANEHNRDDELSRILGKRRVGKFFVLKDAQGKITFQSKSAYLLLEIDHPTSPAHLTVQENGSYVRILNAPLGPENGGGFLQVGYFTAAELAFNKLLSLRDFLEVVGLTMIGLFISFVLARALLRPMRNLSQQVADRAELSMQAAELPRLEYKDLARSFGEPGSEDEFIQLVKNLNTLIVRVNRGYEVSRAWAFQMAHELKTPMAVLTSGIESAEAVGDIKPEAADSFKREIRAMSETVSAFLLWAEVEGTSAQKDLRVVKISSIAAAVAERFGALKIQVEVIGTSAGKVAVNPVYLDIILNNLVQNAAQYSDPGNCVKIRFLGNSIQVANLGPEIAPEVLARLGEPFNRGRSVQTQGHGLGLATVVTIARIFHWRIKFSREGGETQVLLDLSAAVVD